MNRIAKVAFALSLGLALCASADEGKKGEAKKGDKKPAKSVVVPFELLKSGHMAVDVKVNGKGPYKLIFDTGAPVSLVNNKLAADAGLIDGKEKAPKMDLPFDLGEFGKMLGPLLQGTGQAKIKNMEVGGAKAEDVGVIVMDHPTVAALSDALKTPIYGLVGFPFFAQFSMTLDYKAKTMTLTPNGYKPGDTMKELMASMENLMGDLLNKKEAKPRLLSPAAQWGVVCAKEQGDEEDGVDVKGVVPDSAADKAGLKKGDRLLTLDGRWTDSLADLWEAAGYVKGGTTVKVKLRRDKKELTLDVTPRKGM